MISVIVQIKRADHHHHLSIEPQAVTYSLNKHESVTSFYRAYLPAHHTCDHWSAKANNNFVNLITIFTINDRL